jgi:peptidoglycan/xylan/chitin deacetylase (PgdA/CDA1 family)
LHHVRPPRPDRFQPNRILEVTPRFLTRVVKLLARSGIDVISLDEMYRRMTERDFGRRFVCLTFDDGYRDNLEFAYPILREAGFPFAVYVPTSFPDRLGELWWLVLEAVIAKRDRVGLVIEGENRSFDCGTVAEKRALYGQLYWWLRARDSETELRFIVRDLALRYQVDVAAFCKDLCMGWQEIALLARDPLVTIGAHTVNHPALAKLPEKAVRPHGDRVGARRAAGASVLSVWRCRFGWRARIRHRGRARLQDGGDDATRCAVPLARQASHRAAAHLAQR